MASELTPAEVRVLGCLMEKKMTTPENYPLTLNALTNACNQKSTRDPIMTMTEKDVVRALDALREKKLSGIFYGAGSRVAKYEHRFEEAYETSAAETALMCELLLRGPQTAGELRARAQRLHTFENREDVESVLTGLVEREQPLATLLPRQPGRKESRYAHLLSGQPEQAQTETAPPAESARRAAAAEDERFQRIETEVTTLREELEELRREFRAFCKEFE